MRKEEDEGKKGQLTGQPRVIPIVTRISQLDIW